MKPSRLALVVLAPLAVSACGVPDLVAHGVKAYEKSQERSQQAQPEVAQPVQPAPAYQPARYEPEPAPEPVSGVPARESVVSEPLR